MYALSVRRLGQARADLFVGAFRVSRPASPLRLEVRRAGQGPVLRSVAGWEAIDGGGASPIHVATEALDGLVPGAWYDLTLAEPGGAVLARAAFEALPAQLPRGPHGRGALRPFTIWVSSCFHEPNAPEGLARVAGALADSPEHRPHLTILAGDQVYLDFPQWRSLLASSAAALAARFNDVYARTWTHGGFARLLACGATHCLASDHELWNNYPESPIAFPIRSARFWAAWRRLAMSRFQLIQGGAPTYRASVGDQLSLFAADTVIDRGPHGGRFMSDAAMDELEDWMLGLRGPGVLAIGEPILARRTGGVDRHLPDFRQYWQRLLPLLRRSPQHLLVLAGDSHWGRVAETVINPAVGARMVEVVSSPVALVSDSVARVAPRRPRELPAAGGVAATPITYHHAVPTYRCGSVERTEEHGMTVAFHQEEDGAVGVAVRPWLLREPDRPAPWVWRSVLDRKVVRAAAR